MMLFKPRLGAFLSLLIVVLLTGCVAQHRSNEMADKLHHGDIDAILAQMQKRSPSGRDYVQYQLNLGLLQTYAGDFSASTKSLQKAKQVIARLQAKSISENIGAVTVNEVVRSYVASPSERMLLQQLLMINYLMQGDINGARVEVLQSHVIEKSLSKNKGLSGWVASTEYLGGLVYELNNEFDNAMISYRQAYEVHQRNHLPVPRALSDSLLYMSNKLGLNNDYRHYRSTFGYQLAARRSGKASLVVLYWGNVVSHKRQHDISVYRSSLDQIISLALPYYRDYYLPPPLRVNIAGRNVETQPLDDVQKLVRADLKAESKATYAAAMARMVVKTMAINEANRQDESGIAGAIFELATLASEQADLRSWNMLPATIQVARQDVAPGRYRLALNGGAMLPMERDIKLRSSSQNIQQVRNTPGMQQRRSSSGMQQQRQSSSGMQQQRRSSSGMQQQRSSNTAGMQQRKSISEMQQRNAISTMEQKRPPLKRSRSSASPFMKLIPMSTAGMPQSQGKMVELTANKTTLLFYPSVTQRTYSYKEP